MARPLAFARGLARPSRSLAVICWTATTIAMVISMSGGCFSLKEPPCGFSCIQPPNRCPEDYACGTDGLCHRAGATGICTLTPPGDGGSDIFDPYDGGGDDAAGP